MDKRIETNACQAYTTVFTSPTPVGKIYRIDANGKMHGESSKMWEGTCKNFPIYRIDDIIPVLTSLTIYNFVVLTRSHAAASGHEQMQFHTLKWFADSLGIPSEGDARRALKAAGGFILDRNGVAHIARIRECFEPGRILPLDVDRTACATLEACDGLIGGLHDGWRGVRRVAMQSGGSQPGSLKMHAFCLVNDAGRLQAAGLSIARAVDGMVRVDPAVLQPEGAMYGGPARYEGVIAPDRTPIVIAGEESMDVTGYPALVRREESQAAIAYELTDVERAAASTHFRQLLGIWVAHVAGLTEGGDREVMRALGATVPWAAAIGELEGLREAMEEACMTCGYRKLDHDWQNAVRLFGDEDIRLNPAMPGYADILFGGPAHAPEPAAVAVVSDPIDIINERFAHIDEDCVFWDIEHGTQVKYSQIVEKFAPLQIPIEIPDGENIKIKNIPATQLWFKSERRRWHRKVTYAPGESIKSICGGVLNCWTGWGFDLSQLDGTQSSIIEDYRTLIMALANNNPKDAHKMTQWDAWGLQHPNIKLRRGVVYASVVEGTGKTLRAEALGSLHGPKNTLIAGDDAFSGRFSDHLRGKTLIIGEELFNDPKTAARSSSGLKRLVANDTIDTEGKGQQRMVFPNLAAVMVLSNHPDALRIDPYDRRWDVYAPDIILSTEFYARFAGYRYTAPGRAAMAHYLLNYDLTDFDPNARAIMSEAKMNMIEAGRSDLESFLQAMQENPARELWSAEEIQMTYNKQPTVIPASQVTLRAVRLALGRAGVVKRRPNMPENPITKERAKASTMYALRNPELWSAASDTEWLHRKLKS